MSQVLTGIPFRPATRFSSPHMARRLAVLRLIMDATDVAAAAVVIMDAAAAAAEPGSEDPTTLPPLLLARGPAAAAAAALAALPSGTKRLEHAPLAHTQRT